jgi:succinoglycan biosynthesis protein ExoW
MPNKLAVIIPFYQREPGILARALGSIRQQKIPDGWLVEVIVVDDGSPSPAVQELGNLTFERPLKLKLIMQENRGIAAARNRALDEADKDTALIAFLDSDDIWPSTHLERAIRGLTAGYDFFFTDCHRAGYFKSYLREYAPETVRSIAMAKKKDGFIIMRPDNFIGLISREFPAQISTVVYKQRISPDLRFDTRLKAAGEDVLFLCALVATAGSVVYDPANCVKCGTGLNVYFSNLSRQNPKRLAICVDEFVARTLIRKTIKLSPKSRRQNDLSLKSFRKQLAAHIVRTLLKSPSRVPKAIVDIVKKDAVAVILLPLYIFEGGFRLLWKTLFANGKRQRQLTVDEA